MIFHSHFVDPKNFCFLRSHLASSLSFAPGLLNSFGGSLQVFVVEAFASLLISVLVILFVITVYISCFCCSKIHFHSSASLLCSSASFENISSFCEDCSCQVFAKFTRGARKNFLGILGLRLTIGRSVMTLIM